MAILVNLDAVEHRSGGHARALETLGQLDMLMVARPLAERRVEFVAIL